MTDYDRDPAALAWARNRVQEYIDRLADFEQQAKAKRDPITELGCGISRQLAERHFLGDGACVIGVFDERRPTHPDLINNGPTVSEAAADDRRWPLQKAGE